MATKGIKANQNYFENGDLLQTLEDITQMNWFMNYGVIATWLNRFTVPFSLILTQWGLCFNFNMIASSTLFNLNQTSSDLHYDANIINPAYIPSLDSNTFDLNETFPWKATNNRRFLILYFINDLYEEDNPFVERQGYHVIFHNNFEMPFESEKNHVRIGKYHFVTVDFSPVVHVADDSLHELHVNE